MRNNCNCGSKLLFKLKFHENFFVLFIIICFCFHYSTVNAPKIVESFDGKDLLNKIAYLAKSQTFRVINNTTNCDFSGI